MIRVKIIGAGGYGGGGLLELFVRHPQVEVTGVIDVADVGRSIGDLVPHLRDFYDIIIQSPDDPENTKNVDVVFFATPDGVGMAGADKYTEAGIKVIDFSGDFRFDNDSDYASYAKTIGRDPAHKSSHLLDNSTYGLPELHREKLKKSDLIGNPGCFAVSCILGLAPAVAGGVVDKDILICDCKTGVSGAGKKPHAIFHYPARYDCMNAYKLSGHQHVFEIERELSQLGGYGVKIMFTPQVVPLCRGIMSTLYGKLSKGMTQQKVLDIYEDFYNDEPFVKDFSKKEYVATTYVRGTNSYYLTVKVDEDAQRLLVVSHIDNLLKGQAGSAVQNMNILFGLKENMGLDFPGMYP